MTYSNIGFNKCIRIIIIFYIIEDLLRKQLEQGRKVVGKIGSDENNYKVIAIICGGNYFNSKVDLSILSSI